MSDLYCPRCGHALSLHRTGDEILSPTTSTCSVCECRHTPASHSAIAAEEAKAALSLVGSMMLGAFTAGVMVARALAEPSRGAPPKRAPKRPPPTTRKERIQAKNARAQAAAKAVAKKAKRTWESPLAVLAGAQRAQLSVGDMVDADVATRKNRGRR